MLKNDLTNSNELFRVALSRLTRENKKRQNQKSYGYSEAKFNCQYWPKVHLACINHTTHL